MCECSPRSTGDSWIRSDDELETIWITSRSLGDLEDQAPASLDLIEWSAERQPSVGTAGDSLECDSAPSTEQKRRSRPLDGLCSHHAGGDAFVAGGEVDRVGAPDGIEDIEDLLDPLASTGH